MNIDPENRITSGEVILELSEAPLLYLADVTDCSDADSDFSDFTDNWDQDFGGDPGAGGDPGGDPGGGTGDDGFGPLLD